MKTPRISNLNAALEKVLTARRYGKSVLQAQILAEAKRQGENVLVASHSKLSLSQSISNAYAEDFHRVYGGKVSVIDESHTVEEGSFKEPTKLHPWQKEAVVALETEVRKNPVCELPPGAGKSLPPLGLGRMQALRDRLRDYSDAPETAKPTMFKLLETDDRIVAFADEGKDGFFIHTDSSQWVVNGTDSGTFRGKNMTDAIKWYKSQVTRAVSDS